MTNPRALSWTAPTKNTDGTNITYALDYEVGVQQPDNTITGVLTTPGSLNPQGQYEVLVADVAAISSIGSHTVAVRAINRAKPTEKSVWTNTLTFVNSTETPEAPLAFTVS
jgi:hypothetical protein